MAEKKGFNIADVLGGVSNLDTGRADGREQIEYIDIDRIHPDERNFYELQDIEELATNIEFTGLQQPLRVRSEKDFYVIVSGHRRYAALTLLVGEGKEQYRQVACIVEAQSGATDEVEALEQELKLIYGNSNIRKMSSADLSKQAERVEMLLYLLKEAGRPFPGKMRDHVAKACHASASKLARLKVIREGLIPPLKKLWESSKLNESAAYGFAKHEPDVQKTIMEKLKAEKYNSDPRYWYESEVTSWAKRILAEQKLKCRHGYCEMCDNTTRRLERDPHWNDACRDGKCCSGCDSLATCKSACPHLEEEIKAAKAKKKADAAKAKAQQEERVRPEAEFAADIWKRVGEARTRAGLDMTSYLTFAGVGYKAKDEKILKRYALLEEGKKKTDGNTEMPDGLPGRWSIKSLIRLANALGCSIDYLLCRTDDPRLVSETKKDVREWRSRGETPPVGKAIIVHYPTNVGPSYTPAVWDGSRFHAPGNPDKELTGLAQRMLKWTLLPEDE